MASILFAAAAITSAVVIPLKVVPHQPAEIRKPPTIVVSKTNEVIPATKDPVWDVQLVVDGKVVDSVPALIGRSYRQTSDRHVAGNKSPLPQGSYQIVSNEIASAPFAEVELGKGYWIPVQPLFSTQRSALGIHQDPSWGKMNGESGTSGCIGLKTAEDTYKVVNWIQQYKITKINVNS